MIKKCSLIIAFTMIISLLNFNVFANISFPDLGQNHWAFQSVSQLVANGTIKGFEDGTFKPDATVTRAEFVKMIGKGSVRRNTNFNDVSSSYWGYDYIMYSGLMGSDDNNFNPDVPITREDVAQLLWERAGSKQGVIAPSIITSQSKNKAAAAWVYQYGVMIGNDGLHLRLADSLTRAEAAALIIRSRNINENSKQIDFVNTVSEDILKTVYNSLSLFTKTPYEPTKTVTNGQISRAGLRLALEENDLTYRGYPIAAPFSHPYVYDLTAIGSYCLKLDKINKDFIDKQATLQDSLAILTFGAIKKSHTPIVNEVMNNYYNDVTATDNDLANKCLTFANQNGIQLYSYGNINANAPATLKEIAAILLQIDGIIGTQSVITTDKDSSTNADLLLDQKLQKNLEKFPSSKENFKLILADVPDVVYTTPYTVTKSNAKLGKPIMVYDFAREYSDILTGMLHRYKGTLLSKSNVKVRFSYFPSLVCENGNGFTLRVKCEVLELPNELLIKDVFKTSSNVSDTQKIYRGMVFYCDIMSGQSISSIELTDELATLDKIVYIVK